MCELSGGEKTRVFLAGMEIHAPSVILLDEPTNHLDNAMSEWLEEYLIGFRGAIQMDTHDRYFLDRVATRIVEVDQGKLYSYPGNYSEFVKLKAERQDMALATERKRKSLLRTELEWLGRGARARSTKQKAHIDRIKAMQEIKDIQEEKKVVLDSVASRMGNKTIELQNISKSYGARKLIDDYSYIFLKNDRIGIIGPNGCGKTTLLKIINGIVKPDNGTIEIGQTIRIGYFSQENEYMDASMKVIDYVKEVGEYVTTSDGKITASQMLERFLFDGAMQWSKIEKLSGGEKRRLYLMRVLMSAPNVLILDEPTNDLDIQTLTILEDYLDHFDGIIITVSHDRYFLDRIVNRIFSFEGDGKVRQFEGGYSDYLIRKELEGLDTEMSLKDVLVIMTAIGHHDEATGDAVDPVSAALILADKTDVRRNRVQNPVPATFDIHDRVNYAALSTKLTIQKEKKVIQMELELDDEICTVMDYFEIFLERMIMCRRAAERLDCKFKLIANGNKMC